MFFKYAHIPCVESVKTSDRTMWRQKGSCFTPFSTLKDSKSSLKLTGAFFMQVRYKLDQMIRRPRFNILPVSREFQVYPSVFYNGVEYLNKLATSSLNVFRVQSVSAKKTFRRGAQRQHSSIHTGRGIYTPRVGLAFVQCCQLHLVQLLTVH